MTVAVDIHGKAVQIAWTAAAEKEMLQRQSPLLAEMELYFSCLIRKRVRFNEAAGGAEAVAVNGHLRVGFRPVMTQHCVIDETPGRVPLAEFPIVNPKAFVPHWLHLDFRRGQWEGEFGYG